MEVVRIAITGYQRNENKGGLILIAIDGAIQDLYRDGFVNLFFCNEGQGEDALI